MKSFLILLIFSPLIVDASSSLEELKNKITKLNLTNIKAIDLCTNQKINLSKLQYVKVWSIDCTNCLWELEDLKSKLDQRYTLINVDTNKSDRKKSCNWLRKLDLKAISINDMGSLKALLGENYPLPFSLTIKDNKATDIQFGYWRKDSY